MAGPTKADLVQKGAYSREALLREVRDLVAACLARRGSTR